MPDATLIWFRQDLRLADNPVLAAVQGRPVLPVYVLEDGPCAPRRGGAMVAASQPGGARHARWPSAARRCWCCAATRGSVIPELAARIGAGEVHAGRQSEPAARRRDAETHAALQRAGRRLVLHRNALLHEPHLRAHRRGHAVLGLHAVLARGLRPGWKDCHRPCPRPMRRLIAAPARPPAWRARHSACCRPPPEPDWAAEFPTHWTPGEAGATRTPCAASCVTVSPPMPIGATCRRPRRAPRACRRICIWARSRPGRSGMRRRPRAGRGWRPSSRRLLWREFSHHLLWHRPEMPDEPLRPAFKAFPWRHDAAMLAAWQRGRTGIPIVDAGMRQLWRSGWMHNRVRMIVASFLVKHLLQPLAGGRGLVPGHAGRCRPRGQCRVLAVGRRLRGGCGAVFPHLQPGAAGREIRCRRRLCPPLVPRTGRPARPIHPSPA